MKKILTILPFLALIGSRVSAQKKDSTTVIFNYFDKAGNKYGFNKKFDHIPTHHDTLEFRKECAIAMKGNRDSLAAKKAGIGSKVKKPMP